MTKHNMLLKLFKSNRLYLALFTLAIITSSCIPQKKILFFQDKAEENKTEFNTPKPKYQVQPGDELYIRVLSLEEY